MELIEGLLFKVELFLVLKYELADLEVLFLKFYLQGRDLCMQLCDLFIIGVSVLGQVQKLNQLELLLAHFLLQL